MLGAAAAAAAAAARFVSAKEELLFVLYRHPSSVVAPSRIVDFS